MILGLSVTGVVMVGFLLAYKIVTVRYRRRRRRSLMLIVLATVLYTTAGATLIYAKDTTLATALNLLAVFLSLSAVVHP